MSESMQVGVAQTDITPDLPIRLCGYAVRDTETDGIETPLNARALAFSGTDGKPAILVSAECIALTRALTEGIASRLSDQLGIARERIAFCCTHTHYAPCISGALRNMFGKDIPHEHQERIDRYTTRLIDRLEHVAMAAVEDLVPGSLSHASGEVTFAANRRTPGGPADHAMPILVARDNRDVPIAVVANYACHCVTLSTLNRVCGDWAGYASQSLEDRLPSAAALITIGCGSDANPRSRGDVELTRGYGEQIATEAERIMPDATPLPLDTLHCGLAWISLPFESIPSAEEWERRCADDGAMGYHARGMRHRLEQGLDVPKALTYPVQVWSFGDALSMVFLGGEVVVDYALRLKREMPSRPLWISAYANDVPCYIPSRRILCEGGYEAEDSMWYYDQPGRLAPSVEDTIVSAVRSLVDAMTTQG